MIDCLLVFSTMSSTASGCPEQLTSLPGIWLFVCLLPLSALSSQCQPASQSPDRLAWLPGACRPGWGSPARSARPSVSARPPPRHHVRSAESKPLLSPLALAVIPTCDSLSETKMCSGPDHSSGLPGHHGVRSILRWLFGKLQYFPGPIIPGKIWQTIPYCSSAKTGSDWNPCEYFFPHRKTRL